jgi:hypothetical protein
VRADLAAPAAPTAACVEAMRMAHDALHEAVTYVGSPSWSPSMERECREAADALRAAMGVNQPSRSAIDSAGSA